MHVKKELEFQGISMQDPAKFIKFVGGIKSSALIIHLK
jgi:hypothetical protein